MENIDYYMEIEALSDSINDERIINWMNQYGNAPDSNEKLRAAKEIYNFYNE